MHLLHYIKNVCNVGRTLFGTFRYNACEFTSKKCYLKCILFRLLSKLLAFLMKHNFPQRPSGVPFYTLSKFYNVSVGFVITPSFEAQLVVAKG